jgi:hypothetical protein
LVTVCEVIHDTTSAGAGAGDARLLLDLDGPAVIAVERIHLVLGW